MTELSHIRPHVTQITIGTVVATASVAVIVLAILSHMQFSFQDFALSKSITMYALGGLGIIAGIVWASINKKRVTELTSDAFSMLNIHRSPLPLKHGNRSSTGPMSPIPSNMTAASPSMESTEKA